MDGDGVLQWGGTGQAARASRWGAQGGVTVATEVASLARTTEADGAALSGAAGGGRQGGEGKPAGGGGVATARPPWREVGASPPLPGRKVGTAARLP